MTTRSRVFPLPIVRCTALLGAAIAASMTLVASTSAEEYVVSLMNDGDSRSYQISPEVLRIEVGDTVVFKSEGGMHASKSIPGMMPADAQPWWGKMGEDLLVRFDVPGVYGYKCPATYSLGMVGLIIVGDDMNNMTKAKKVRHPPEAAQSFNRLFATVNCYSEPEPPSDCPDTDDATN